MFFSCDDGEGEKRFKKHEEVNRYTVLLRGSSYKSEKCIKSVSNNEYIGCVIYSFINGKFWRTVSYFKDEKCLEFSRNSVADFDYDSDYDTVGKFDLINKDKSKSGVLNAKEAQHNDDMDFKLFLKKNESNPEISESYRLTRVYPEFTIITECSDNSLQ